MSTPQPVNGNGIAVWRWVAALVTSIMIASVPGLYLATSAPTRSDLNDVRNRQVLILERVNRLEAKLDALQDQTLELHAELDAHTRAPP